MQIGLTRGGVDGRFRWPSAWGGAGTDLLHVESGGDWVEERQCWSAKVERPVVVVERWNAGVFPGAEDAAGHGDSARALNVQAIEPVDGKADKETEDCACGSRDQDGGCDDGEGTAGEAGD